MAPENTLDTTKDTDRFDGAGMVADAETAQTYLDIQGERSLIEQEFEAIQTTETFKDIKQRQEAARAQLQLIVGEMNALLQPLKDRADATDERTRVMWDRAAELNGFDAAEPMRMGIDADGNVRIAREDVPAPVRALIAAAKQVGANIEVQKINVTEAEEA